MRSRKVCLMFGFIGKSLDIHALKRNRWKGGMGVAIWLIVARTKKTRHREYKEMIKRKYVNALLAIMMFSDLTIAGIANVRSDSEDDTRMVDAKVVEVTDTRISLIAQTGVEHVIAIDNVDTKVKIENKIVSLKNVKEGDIVTVELDESSAVKFAKNIVIEAHSNSQVARVKP